MIWLNDTRILAAIAIICVHVSQATINHAESINTMAWIVSNTYLSFSLWGVPVFVMISGALLLSPERNYPTISIFYFKRVKRLLIPLAFWTAFYILWSYLKSYNTNYYFTTNELLDSLIGGRPYYHMWYFYMVFGLYLFTPYFRKIVKHSSRNELLLLSIMLLLISMLSVAMGTSAHYSTLFIEMFPLYIGYFFLGHIINTTLTTLKKSQLFILFIFCGILTAVGHYLEVRYSFSTQYFYQNFSITIVPMSILLFIFIKKLYAEITITTKTLVLRERLSRFSLGAYLIHPAIFDVIKTFNYFGFMPDEYTIIMIPILVIVITTLSLLAVYIISKVPYIKKVV